MTWGGEQWEYRVVDLTQLDQKGRERALNAAGLEGYEVVTVGPYWAYMKRPVALVMDEKGFWVEEGGS